MSLDLYAREISQDLSRLDGTKTIGPGAFDGFLRGTSIYAMKGLAGTARAIDMAGAPFAMAQDAFTGGTEAQDRYFKEHDEVLNSAVDFWTPKPLEVGVAAEIAGGLIGQLPTIIASPHLAVGAQVLSTAEDLARENVPAGKAVAAGVVQGAGLATGIWMPILGQNAFQRMVIGGAGFNFVQGAATRGATGLILEGTPAAEAFKTLDPKAMTLDVLLGLAFGGMAHISPAQRAQGKAAWEKVQAWAENMKPSEVAAIATLRTAQHLNEDSAPGKPAEPKDVEAHVERMRTAIDQLAKDKPVEVSDLPAPDSNPDNARFSAAARRAEQMQAEGEKLAKAYDLVLEEPIGPANDPLVRMTPEGIGEVLVERGPAFQKQGSADIKVGGYGLVKIIWKHGEKSNEPKGFDVTREDVLRLPEIMREFKPIQDEPGPTGGRLLEWQVERADGKKVIYATRKFTKGDERQHVVSVMVNKEGNESMKAKPLSEKANRPAESPTAEFMSGVRDTGPQSLLSPEGGQKGGSDASIETEAPAGQPRGAEPPPPRGSSEGKPAGAEATKPPDPLAIEAARIAKERPDLRVVVGTDADGKPITKTAAEFLAEAEGGAKALEADQGLLRAAASCLLGIA